MNTFSNKILKSLSLGLLSLMVITLFAGCDSTEEEELSAIERFLGTWAVTTAADQDGARDQTAAFAALGQFGLVLNDDESYVLSIITPATDDEDTVLPGSFIVNESASRLVLSVVAPGIPAGTELTFNYAFDSDNVVMLTIDSFTLGILAAAITGESPDWEGNIVLTLNKS